MIISTSNRLIRKWCNIELYLQWPTNRKSYMICRKAPFSMILNDPYLRFQGHAILWRWISQKRYETQTYFQWNANRDLPTRPTQQCHFEWLWVTQQNIQSHEASRGLSAAAEVLVQNRFHNCLFLILNELLLSNASPSEGGSAQFQCRVWHTILVPKTSFFTRFSQTSVVCADKSETSQVWKETATK